MKPLPSKTLVRRCFGSSIFTPTSSDHGWPEKWFGLVSGFLERGETPEEGMRRELAEELALVVCPADHLGATEGDAADGHVAVLKCPAGLGESPGYVPRQGGWAATSPQEPG